MFKRQNQGVHWDIFTWIRYCLILKVVVRSNLWRKNKDNSKLREIRTSLFSGVLRLAFMMVAVSASETSVNFYETTRPKIPEDNHFYTRLCENLKSRFEVSATKLIMWKLRCLSDTWVSWPEIFLKKVMRALTFSTFSGQSACLLTFFCFHADQTGRASISLTHKKMFCRLYWNLCVTTQSRVIYQNKKCSRVVVKSRIKWVRRWNVQNNTDSLIQFDGIKAVICSLFCDAFSVNILYSIDDRVTSEWWWIDEDKHLCLKRDSSPRSQRPDDLGLRFWDRR
jgi:hypothetical protein